MLRVQAEHTLGTLRKVFNKELRTSCEAEWNTIARGLGITCFLKKNFRLAYYRND
jgi:hypothetical protein